MIATVGVDELGQAYNINADTVAGAIAEALRRREARVPHRRRRALRRLSPTSRASSRGSTSTASRRCSADGKADGGMIPKLQSCLARAARRRAARAHPRRPHPARAPARVLHPGGHRHDDRREAERAMTTLRRHPCARRRARHADLRPAPGRVRPRRGRRSSGTARARSTSTSSAASRSPRSGHAHPAVADALAEQARTLLHVSNLYFNEWQPQVAARLDALLGGGGKVFFSNSGAEANECAIKLARRYGQANGGPERFHVLSALRLVPRPHAHHARRHRPAAEAGDVPAAADRASARSCSPTSTRWRRRWTSGCAR